MAVYLLSFTPSGSKLRHELSQSVKDDVDVDIDGEHELDDYLGLDAQLDALFSSTNPKQDLMRFRSPAASLFKSSSISGEVARIVFFLEEYARAARLLQLQLR
jgi:hypothetical protein